MAFFRKSIDLQEKNPLTKYPKAPENRQGSTAEIQQRSGLAEFDFLGQSGLLLG